MQRIRNCLFADDVLYDTDMGVWARPEGDLVSVGIDSVRAWLSGAFTTVSFKPLGFVVERGLSLGSAEGPRHFDTVRSPLSGTIVKINTLLTETPKTLNQDPYGRGWFAKLRPSKFQEEEKMLRRIDAARDAIERRVVNMNVRCFAEFPDYEMYEIGSECSGVLVKLDELVTRSPKGTVIHLVSDDVTAEIELIAWSERTGQRIVESRKEGNLFHFIVEKSR
jgi:glycine cleavage system H protein